MNRLFTLLAALVLAAPVAAHEFKVGDLEIIHPHMPQPSASAKTAGGYFSIVNEGTEPDRLIGVEAGFAAKSMVHESKVDADGIGTMTHIDAIEIPAGATVELAQGGLHVMFMGLTGPMKEGELYKATLIFEKAGPVEVEFKVDPPAGAESADPAAMDHSKMDHGAGG